MTWKVILKNAVYGIDDPETILRTRVQISNDHLDGVDMITISLDGNQLSLNDQDLIDKTLDAFYREHYAKKAEKEFIVDITQKLEEQNQVIDSLQESVKKAEVMAENAMKSIVNKEDLTPEQKEEIIETYPSFEAGVEYEGGTVIEYDGKLYRVIKRHKSQADWLPDIEESLYTEYLNFKTTIVTEDPETGEEIVEEVEVISNFKQPTGAHDAYAKGAKVRFNGKIYESTIDNNAYSPTDYPQGWKVVE